MSSVPVIINGASGRMGASIRELLDEESGMDFYHGVDVKVGDYKGSTDVSEIEKQTGQVLIDFSTPDSLMTALNWCVENSCPIISGTTGIGDKHQSELDKAASQIPVLWAPNMSVGVAVFHKLIENLAVMKDNFDFRIEEVHHNKKIDSPSGTALFLHEKLEQSLDRKVEEPLAIRGGGVFGIHKLWAMSDEETLTIEHTALNRKVFARGSIVAAKWLSAKGPGRYTMADVLSF